MKLEKIVNLIDTYGDVKLYLNDYVVWTGSIISLQAASDNDQQYLKELREDNDFATIEEVTSAKRWLDYKLDTSNEEYPCPIDIRVEENEHGNKVPVIYIYITPKEKKEK